jgi:transcriptional regulator with XRE-family HTH domain
MNEISSTMPAKTIAHLLGQRLKQARLNANWSQIQLAEKAGLSRTAVTNAEQGKVHLESFIALLQALSLTENLDVFLPVQDVSPLQLIELSGKRRQRAAKRKDKAPSSNKSTW